MKKVNIATLARREDIVKHTHHVYQRLPYDVGIYGVLIVMLSQLKDLLLPL